VRHAADIGSAVRHANQALRKLAADRGAAVVNIDTRLDVNTTGLFTCAQIESLIARMDVVLTTRLHGTVFTIKNGVPALAIDSVVGGGKIRRQADPIGWPCALAVESITDEALRRAFSYCLTSEAREKAKDCASRAREQIENVRAAFIGALGDRA
jgi:polysaccharide pyruvyl transferase WcaK-like protein